MLFHTAFLVGNVMRYIPMLPCTHGFLSTSEHPCGVHKLEWWHLNRGSFTMTVCLIRGITFNV